VSLLESALKTCDRAETIEDVRVHLKYMLDGLLERLQDKVPSADDLGAYSAEA
jgi:hypothetical protein